MKRTLFVVAIIALLATGCSGTAAQVSSISIPAVNPTATLEPSPVPTAAPTLSLSPNAYTKYTINYLRSRQYGGGQIQVVQSAGAYSAFTRYIIRYPSDGLTITGFMDVPNGLGPFPVVIALHGYVAPSTYNTLDYTTTYADDMASAGYFVLHPNMRNFPPSSSGDDLFRVGMATDVLNLIAIVKATGGKSGPLQLADPQRIGLWGHGMGGGIALRVMTISPDVKAAVLYSSVSGDEQRNYEALAAWSDFGQGGLERAVPLQELPLISPIYFYQNIKAAVSVNQGLADPMVPVQWAKDTCNQLQEMGKTVECHYYPAEANTFTGNGDHSFIRVFTLFFDKYLRGT